MIDFDKLGYTNSFPFMVQTEAMKTVTEMENVQRIGSVLEWSALVKRVMPWLGEFEKIMAKSFDYKSFVEFLTQFRIRRSQDPVGFFMRDYARSMGSDYIYDMVNEALISYHTLRFIANGKSVYKIAPRKAEFLAGIKLEIPGSLLVIPHPEFMISVPKGIIKTGYGDLLNIYVSEDVFEPKWYEQANYETDAGVKWALSQGEVKRIVRALGVFYTEGGSNTRTAYFQLPVVEGIGVVEMFTKMCELSPHDMKPLVEAVFGFTLNVCAYLGTKEPEIEKVLGIKYETTAKANPKKIKIADRNRRLYGYNHVYVGRIYDERYRDGGEDIEVDDGNGGKIIRRFKVRAHIRAQWYGAKTEASPGTHQQLILIKEFEKGADLDVALSSKVVVVGNA